MEYHPSQSGGVHLSKEHYFYLFCLLGSLEEAWLLATDEGSPTKSLSDSVMFISPPGLYSGECTLLIHPHHSSVVSYSPSALR